jgi:hypothetical protein
MVLLDRKRSGIGTSPKTQSLTKSKKKLDKVTKYGIMVTLNERSHRPTATKTTVRGVNRNSKETENYQERN